MLIDHLGIAISDFDVSKKFYSKVLAPLNIELIVEDQGWAGFGKNRKAELWFSLDKIIHSPIHIAFVIDNSDKVNQFYEAARDESE